MGQIVTEAMKKKGVKESRGHGVCARDRVHCPTLCGVVREDLDDNMTLEERPERTEGIRYADTGQRAVQGEIPVMHLV